MEQYIKSSRIKGAIGVISYYIGQYFGVALLIASYVALKGFKTKQEALDGVGAVSTTIMAITLLITLIVIVGVNFKELKEQLVLNLKNKWTYIYPMFLMICYFISLSILQNMITKFTPDLGVTDNQSSLNDMFVEGNAFIYVLVAVVLAPVVEELVFRYSLVNLIDIQKKYLKWVPYFVSAILFASIHETAIFTSFSIDNLFNFLTYFIPALVLSFGYMATKRNIVSLIIVHLVINGLSTLIMFITTFVEFV